MQPDHRTVCLGSQDEKWMTSVWGMLGHSRPACALVCPGVEGRYKSPAVYKLVEGYYPSCSVAFREEGGLKVGPSMRVDDCHQ